MALVFEPEGLIYDATERLIRIFAIDGPRAISCAVSKAALIALEGPHPRDRRAQISGRSIRTRPQRRHSSCGYRRSPRRPGSIARRFRSSSWQESCL